MCKCMSYWKFCGLALYRIDEPFVREMEWGVHTILSLLLFPVALENISEQHFQQGNLNLWCGYGLCYFEWFNEWMIPVLSKYLHRGASVHSIHFPKQERGWVLEFGVKSHHHGELLASQSQVGLRGIPGSGVKELNTASQEYGFLFGDTGVKTSILKSESQQRPILEWYLCFLLLLSLQRNSSCSQGHLSTQASGSRMSSLRKCQGTL